MADAKTDTKDETDLKAEKKSSGFMGQILLAVAGGAAAFGTVFFMPQKTVAEVPICESDITHHAEEEERAPEPPSLDEIAFVALEPLLISLGRAGESRHLKIGLTLETPYGYEYDIEHAQPKLRDAFTGYLRALEIDQLDDPASMVRLRSQLLRRAEVVLGTDAVHGVLITDFLVR